MKTAKTREKMIDLLADLDEEAVLAVVHERLTAGDDPLRLGVASFTVEWPLLDPFAEPFEPPADPWAPFGPPAVVAAHVW